MALGESGGVLLMNATRSILSEDLERERREKGKREVGLLERLDVSSTSMKVLRRGLRCDFRQKSCSR